LYGVGNLFPDGVLDTYHTDHNEVSVDILVFSISVFLVSNAVGDEEGAEGGFSEFSQLTKEGVLEDFSDGDGISLGIQVEGAVLE